jgi:type IV pilus assembly protein PilW
VIQRWQQSSLRTRSCGATLIELMVALLIGLLLVAGAVTVYTQSRSTYRITETAARLQEVARYAMDTIEPDIRLAGYWGLTNDANFIENKATPTDTQITEAVIASGSCGTNWAANLTRFIDGRDASATGGAGYNLGCAATTPRTTSDVLIVRRASADTRPLTNGRIQLQTNRMRGVIFSNGVVPAGFTAAPGSATHDLVVNAYYISDRGIAANGLRQYELRRQTLIAGQVRDDQIIPGVEDLQVQFGADVNNDGNADRYVNPGAAILATARVTAARIWIRVVAEDHEVGYTNPTTYTYANAAAFAPADNRRRVLFSKTIRIRNSRS